MKYEDYAQRVQQEKNEERIYEPPFYECSCASEEDPRESVVWKLQSASDVIGLFPWAEKLIRTWDTEFHLQLVDETQVIKISKVR